MRALQCFCKTSDSFVCKGLSRGPLWLSLLLQISSQFTAMFLQIKFWGTICFPHFLYKIKKNCLSMLIPSFFCSSRCHTKVDIIRNLLTFVCDGLEKVWSQKFQEKSSALFYAIKQVDLKGCCSTKCILVRMRLCFISYLEPFLDI